MLMKKTFSQSTRLNVFEAWNGYCCVQDCMNKATEAHHALPNTKLNNKLFPLFIHSAFNLKPVCRYHHENYTMFPELKITIKLAEVYEMELKK